MQFRSRTLTYVIDHNAPNIGKIILPQHSQKSYYFTNFPKNMFLVGAIKKICTAPFLDALELNSRSTWDVCTSLYIYIWKFLFQKRRKLLTDEGLNNSLDDSLSGPRKMF